MDLALRLRSVRVALVVAGLAGLAMCASSLLGKHGVESALLLGVVLPPFTAAVGARIVIALRRQGTARAASRVLSTAVGTALLVLAVPFVLLALNTLRVRQCTPLEGLAYMGLGPAFGVALAAVTGVFVAAHVPRARLATFIAVLCPLGSLAAGVYRFWSTPAISVFSHYAGWFPGTIYDEDITLPMELITFRLVSLSLVLGLALLVSADWDAGLLGARLAPLRHRAGRAGTGVLLVVGVVVATAYGPELGHRTTSAFIAQELGATRRGERCIVHAPRNLRADRLRQLVEDCDYSVRKAERFFGIRRKRPVEAFFFQSAAQKRRHMGAGSTYIAKPWRDETYLQLRSWPHPVLAHEVAHVVAGSVAEGPWKVGGSLGGWLPNPALIEGVAVATEWQPQQDLSPHQWARAMLELDRMPSLRRIFGLTFMLQPPRHAYTAAGSFVRFVRERYGTEAVRTAHRTGNIEAATGETLATLEDRWHRFLRQVPLPPAAEELARVRFAGRSIFSAVCPHRLAHLERRLGEDLAAGDDGRVRRTCRHILRIDPTHMHARSRLVGALAREGYEARAREQLAALQGSFDAPAPVLARAREALADAAWRRGEAEHAQSIYRELLQLPQPDDQARAREVKALAIEAGGRQRRLVRQILVGRGPQPTRPPVVVHLARELTEVRSDGLGPYLEARQLHHRRRYELALPLLRKADRRGLPTERLRRENERLIGAALYATGQLDAAERHWRQLAGAEGASEARRITARDWLARIAWRRRR